MSARQLCLFGFIAALMLAKSASVVFLMTAARADPASGRANAYIFASIISNSPSYITTRKGWVLAVCFGAEIACFLVWAALALRVRLRADG